MSIRTLVQISFSKLTSALVKFYFLCGDMSLFTASLNSGSNGNCYYVGNTQEAVLIDAGISCRETEKRMLRAGLNVKKVKAIFISHEHSDHIRGLEVLAKKYDLPVYITEPTLKSGRLKLSKRLVKEFVHHEAVNVGDLKILPFTKSHDAADPYSFTISNDNTTIGVFTDIGTVCDNLKLHFSKCNAAYLETNYDEKMLAEGHYPIYLKKRIQSDKGHLSNFQALELFNEHRSERLSHLFLSHLSKENNHPDLVRDEFLKHAKNTTISVASRDKESAVYKIGSLLPGNDLLSGRDVQMSLF